LEFSFGLKRKGAQLEGNSALVFYPKKKAPTGGAFQRKSVFFSIVIRVNKCTGGQKSLPVFNPKRFVLGLQFGRRALLPAGF
jgi:hypothetical protein